MRNAIVILCVLATAASAMAAQAVQQPPTKREVEESVARTREIQQKIADASPSAMTTNVQVELTIVDQTGSAPPDKKTVSMIVAQGAWGKIRTSAEAYQKSTQSKIVPVGLNVDARPSLIAGGQIRLELTIVYSPMMLGSSTDSAQTRPTELNQSLTVALQSGKPMVVSQAADPVSDRKIGVEVKATILK